MAGESVGLELCGLWVEEGNLSGGGWFVVKTPDAKWEMEVRAGSPDGACMGRMWGGGSGDLRATGSFGGKGGPRIKMWSNNAGERGPVFKLKLYADDSWKTQGDAPKQDKVVQDDGWDGVPGATGEIQFGR